MINRDAAKFEALERIRRAYLDGDAGNEDYWHAPDDLAWYDETFARRIGWKWEYVLRELGRFGWRPPSGALTDWGCGSGVAGRVVIGYFGTDCFTKVRLYDRSASAMNFARGRLADYCPKLSAEAADSPEVHGGTVLVSHVITELAPPQLRLMAKNLRSAEAIIWVEPGSYPASRALIAAREMLRGDFSVVAPCVHAGVCGMTAPSNKRHWCHFFAESPPEAYTEREWSHFAAKTGINLSDLPLSYLVLDKRPAESLPPDSVRIIARPHVEKADAAVTGCTEAGVAGRLLTKKRLPDDWRSFKKGDFDSLRRWRTEGREITALEDAPGFR